MGRGEGLGRPGPRAAPANRLCCVRRRFGTKCAGCAQGISPSDLVRKARSKVFHLNCFTCMVCNKQLSTGEELYVIDENKFVCKEDYLSSSSLKEGSLNSGRGLRPSRLAQPGALDCAHPALSTPGHPPGRSRERPEQGAGGETRRSQPVPRTPGHPLLPSTLSPIQESFPSGPIIQLESGQFPRAPFLSSWSFLPALGGH